MTLARLPTYPRSAYAPIAARTQALLPRTQPSRRGWGEPCKAAQASFTVTRPRDGKAFNRPMAKALAPLAQVALQGALDVGHIRGDFEIRTKDEPDGGYGTYACRPIRGSTEHSWHSWPVCWDMNSAGNPMSTTWRSTMPPWLVTLFESCGFYWGGRYPQSWSYDAMHFEYLGRPTDVAGDIERAKVAIAALLPPPKPDPTKVTMAQFQHQIARYESSFRWTHQNATSGAYGYYQIMPKNWKTWAPKVLGTDPALAVGDKAIPPSEWVPPPTKENQQAVIDWRFNSWYRLLGDWRRLAANWQAGGTRGTTQPGDKNPDGSYIWLDKTLKYVTNITRDLGFEPTTRETILPPLPGTAPEPEPEPKPEDPAVTPEQIKALQTLLNSLGAKLAVDGIYGPMTDAALQAAGGSVQALQKRATDAEGRAGVLHSAGNMLAADNEDSARRYRERVA